MSWRFLHRHRMQALHSCNACHSRAFQCRTIVPSRARQFHGSCDWPMVSVTLSHPALRCRPQFRPAAIAELFPSLEELDLTDVARQIKPASLGALRALAGLRCLVINKWRCVSGRSGQCRSDRVLS